MSRQQNSSEQFLTKKVWTLADVIAAENTNGRWRKYTCGKLVARDKTSFGITWMKSGEDAVDYSLPELMTMMEEKSDNIVKVMSKLKLIISNIEE